MNIHGDTFYRNQLQRPLIPVAVEPQYMLVNLMDLQNLMVTNPVGSTMVFGPGGKITQDGVDVTNTLPGVTVTPGGSTGTTYHTETGSVSVDHSGSSTSSGSSSTTTSPVVSTSTTTTTSSGAVYMQAFAAAVMGVMISMF